jgi:hypothetical protein
MTADQGAALTLWLLAAGFGLPAPFVGLYLLRRDELPSFFGLFRVYGGGFFEAFPKTIFVLLLAAFSALGVAEVWSGILLWRDSDAGVTLALALLPIEIVFWLGFALPIPWVFGLARVLLLALD